MGSGWGLFYAMTPGYSQSLRNSVHDLAAQVLLQCSFYSEADLLQLVCRRPLECCSHLCRLQSAKKR